MPTYDVGIKTGRLVQVTCEAELTSDAAVMLVQNLLLEAGGFLWMIQGKNHPVRYETPKEWQQDMRVVAINQFGDRYVFKFTEQKGQ